MAVVAHSTYCVWELTLACNLGCVHCGSRAGDPRKRELTTAEALDLVDQLADVGIREVTLIGGEAFLRSDWLEIARAISRRGMVLEMVTGGYGIAAGAAERMRDAGFRAVSVSIDGLETTHDGLRGRAGSFRSCFATLAHLRNAGIPIAVNTQINRLTAPELPTLYERLRAAGAYVWQLALTVPMGRAADRPDILMQPVELLDLYEVLACVAVKARSDGVKIQAGNNIGYYGPYERLLRDHPNGSRFWQGCPAGVTVLGIEADGTIKGCPSLPTSSYAAGNVTEHSLRELLSRSPELGFNLGRTGTRAGLWGECATCEYAPLCRSGCSWTAHVFFGRRGNNVYCHHRALEMRRRGRRERVLRSAAPPGLPFDHGCFEIIEEPFDAPWPDPDPLRFHLNAVIWPQGLTPPIAPSPVLGTGETVVHRPPAEDPLPAVAAAPEFGVRDPFASSLDRLVTLSHIHNIQTKIGSESQAENSPTTSVRPNG